VLIPTDGCKKVRGIRLIGPCREECLGIVLEALAPSVQRLMNEKRVTSRDAMVHARPPGTTRCLPISIYEYTP
jgi:hypothetical protein